MQGEAMKDEGLTGDLALDRICIAFERALRENESPSIEAIVQANPNLNDRKLIEQLVMLEVEFLAEKEQLPGLEHYQERFPQQSAVIVAILEACKSGTAMRTAAHEPSEQVGESIGHYRLLEQIGEGGMGVVFMAEQTKPVRRKVALKIIKPGMDTKQVIARFEVERQALAMMDHPNIARVLDAGSTESGRPYFVMELVRGIPITEYCDQNKLPTNERLELFVNVCQAVQHAHTKGIIHRDIKPSNVLVTHHDGAPIPKIIDFGVAKATNQQLTERTLFTAFAQMIGTPLYMSPEQAEMSGLDVDTRSDVYSLGVLLYELLTGTTPVAKKRMQTAAFDEIRRMIREEDPAKPSTAISTLGEKAKTISMRRGTDANKLRQNLSGELDWIVMKALEKDRTRRFQTASVFAEDVQRHLTGETVQACPPTVSYRLKKFATRYQAQVAVATTFLLMLVGSTLLAWSLYAKARQAKEDAIQSAASEKQAKDDAIEAQYVAVSQRTRAEENLKIANERRDEIEKISKGWMQTHYVHNLNQASTAFEKQSQVELFRLLNNCNEASRGWEWHWLKNSIEFRQTLPLVGPPITGFAVSPDGTMLAVTDQENDLRIHQFPSGVLLKKIQTRVSVADSLSWSNDNQLVAVATRITVSPGQARIWNVHTGEEIYSIDDGGSIGHCSFHPDGIHIMVPRPQEIALEYRKIGDPNPIWTKKFKKVPMGIFSPDGKKIYVSEVNSFSGSGESAIHCFDTKSKTELWKHDVDAMSTCAVTSDGQRIFGAGPDRTIIERNAITGEVIKAFDSGNEHGAFFMMLDSNDHYLTTVSRSDSVMHDLQTGTIVGRDRSPATGGQFLPDGNQMMVKYGSERDLRIVDADHRESDLVLAGHEGNIKSGFLASHQASFFTGSVDGTLREWDLDTGQELNVYEVPNKIYATAGSLDGEFYATGGNDGLELWNARTHRQLKKWPKDEVGRIYWIAFSIDGKRIAACGDRGTAWVWDTASREYFRELEIESGDCDGIDFCSTDGTRIAVLPRSTGQVEIWSDDSDESQKLRGGDSKWNAREVRWCEARNMIAFGTGARVELWKLPECKRIRVLTGHQAPVSALAFNSDGSRLFSGSVDGVLKAWDMETHEPLLSIPAHQSVEGGGNSGQRGIETIVWSEARQAVITCGGDGVAKVWESRKPVAAISNQRRVVAKAMKWVNELYGVSPKQRDVLAKLNEDQDSTDEIRRIATQITSARGDRPTGPYQPKAFRVSNPDVILNLKNRFSALREGVEEFARATSNIPLDAWPDELDPGAMSLDNWYREARSSVDPRLFGLEEVEALLIPLAAKHPSAHHFHYMLGCRYAQNGNWEQAYEHLNSSVILTPKQSPFWFAQAYDLAPVALLAGRNERYRELAKQSVELNYAFHPDPSTARRATKLLAIVEEPVVDVNRIADHIRSPALTASTDWYRYSRALAEYRVRNYEGVLSNIQRTLKDCKRPHILIPAKLLAAMALHRTGETEKAKDLFDTAKTEFENDYLPSKGDLYTDDWHDYAFARLIFLEAKTMFEVQP